MFNAEFRHIDSKIVKSNIPDITVRDGSFSSGNFALACSSCLGILVDQLQIKHTICLTKTSLSKLAIVAPIAGRWTLKNKDTDYIRDMFLISDNESNKRSNWQIVTKNLGYD